MQGQLKQLGLAPFVKAAPTAAQVREEFAGMAWNALTPVFKALAPWTGVVSGSMQSSLQSLLGVQVYVYQGPACNQGDAFQNQIDRMLYNNGQPLTAGSAPLYGTYWNGGAGVSAQQALSQIGPYLAGAVGIVAGMWIAGPAAILGMACPAIMALSFGGTSLVVNIIGGATSGMLAQSFGASFNAGAQAGVPIFGRVISAGNAWNSFQEGDVLGGVLNLFGALVGGACFTAETKVLTARGWVRMDEVKEGDRVASADEHDPFGPVDFKPIMEVYQFPPAHIWHVHVKGQVIRTTGLHPFYVWGTGWVAAKDLEPGDCFRSHDGRMVTVDEVFDSGMEEPVYNCAVADYHTYFVGEEEWGFSAWAHNACDMHHGTPREIIKRAPPRLTGAIRGRAGSPNRIAIDRTLHQGAHNGGLNGGQPRYNVEFQTRLNNIARNRPLTAQDFWDVRSRLLWEYFGIP